MPAFKRRGRNHSDVRWKNSISKVNHVILDDACSELITKCQVLHFDNDQQFNIIFYVVYDASETYIYMRKAWMDYFAGRITIQDVCRQYDEAGVDAIVDGPGNYFWQEMMEYWPKAKVILTVRDNEDKVILWTFSRIY